MEPQNLDKKLCCGSYEVVRLLGWGASSQTFLAQDRSSTSPSLCVVQQVSPRPSLNVPLKELSKHPQLPTLLDSFEKEGFLYLVQEYIKGDNLATLLQRKGKFSSNEVQQVLEGLLPVLDWIHSFGLLHGDIKPENIISQGGTLTDLFLVDLGGVKLPHQGSIPSVSLAGSPAYAAPEQLQGNPVLASDLYSLGVTCLHLLTGVHPFGLLESWRDYWSKEERDERLGLLLDGLIAPLLPHRITSVSDALCRMGKGKKKASRPLQLSPTWQCSATLKSDQRPLSAVNAIALSPSNNILASVSDDKIVRLWDIETQQEILALAGHSQFVKTVAFSPHSQPWVVSGSWDRSIKIWNPQTGHLEQTILGHQNKVNVVVFSPDGGIIASGGLDKMVRLWHFPSGEIIASFKAHNLAITSLAFSSNILATGSTDSTVKLWDRSSLKLLHTLTGHIGAVKTVAFSPGGQCLASGGDDRTIRLWDVSSGECIATLGGHPWLISSLLFSPDGETLLSGSWDKTVKLWEVKTGKVVSVLQGHTDCVTCLAMTKDGRTIISASNDQTIKLWTIQL